MDFAASQNYQLKWESRSSVRTRPRKTIDFSLAGDFFPVEKQDLFLLPEVRALEKQTQQNIQLLMLYKYLEDIIQLETQCIYRACDTIMNKKTPVIYSDIIKRNASTVIIDEYYHVYIAYDLLAQLRVKFPYLPDLNNNFSDAMHAILTIKAVLHEKYHSIFEILAVCIFETTLLRELVTYFDSKTVHPIIKYYINDHMNDEAKHYEFFYELLCYTWSNLPEDYKQNIGSQLGDFLILYLNVQSRVTYNTNVLAWVLDDRTKSKSLVEKLYQGFKLSPKLPIVKNVLSVLTKSGVLSHDVVRKSFERSGLINQR